MYPPLSSLILPLFKNSKLVSTNTEIVLDSNWPIFWLLKSIPLLFFSPSLLFFNKTILVSISLTHNSHSFDVSLAQDKALLNYLLYFSFLLFNRYHWASCQALDCLKRMIVRAGLKEMVERKRNDWMKFVFLYDSPRAMVLSFSCSLSFLTFLENLQLVSSCLLRLLRAFD